MTHKTSTILLLTGMLIALLFVGGCEGAPALGDCFTSTGNIVTETREVPYFHSIQLNDNLNLQLRQAGQQKVSIEAGSNLMDKITLEVSPDSILIISNENSCNWVRSYDKPMTVYLDFTELKELEYRSIGDVTNTDTIRLDTLTLNIWEGAGNINLVANTYTAWINLHYGTANVVISGNSTLTFFYQLGAGKIDAKDFKTHQVYMRNWGSNDMYVWASSFLSVEIKGLGNVYYKGNPSINSNLIGQGQLIPL